MSVKLTGLYYGENRCRAGAGQLARARLDTTEVVLWENSLGALTTVFWAGVPPGGKMPQRKNYQQLLCFLLVFFVGFFTEGQPRGWQDGVGFVFCFFVAIILIFNQKLD